MKIKIITLIDRNEDFIELQYNSIKRFVKNQVEYVVFNNSKDDNRRIKINDICSNLGIQTYSLSGSRYGEPSVTVSNSLNEMWQKYVKDMDGIVFYMDSDMFFISEIDIENIGSNYDIAYIPQYRDNNRIEYMWSGIFLLNLDTIDKNIDFSLGGVEGAGTDTGGKTYYFLKNRDYRKLYLDFYNIGDITDGSVETYLNGNFGAIRFKDKTLEIEYSQNKIFPHERESENYFKNYIDLYDNHIDLINQYGFPKPYHFDLIKMTNDNKFFIFHYKSSNWESRYGNGENEHSILKKEALKRMINVNM